VGNQRADHQRRRLAIGTVAWMRPAAALLGAAARGWTVAWMQLPAGPAVARGPDAGADRATGGSDARTSTPAGGKTGAAQTIKNINYAGTSSASQTLDLLLPANALLPLPLVSASTAAGSAAETRPGGNRHSSERDLAKGYALASVNYRPFRSGALPAGVQDVKAAVRWLRAHAAQYGLDSDRFASWGESAGGYMAVMLG